MTKTGYRISFSFDDNTVDYNLGYDGEGAGAVEGRQTVLFQRTGTPAVDTAYTAMLTI